MDFTFRTRKRGREDDDDAFGIRIEGVPADKVSFSLPWYTSVTETLTDLAQKQRSIAHPNLHLPSWPELRPTMHRAHTLPFRLDHPNPPPPPHNFFEHHFEAESPTDESSGNSPASFVSLPAPPDFNEMEMDLGHHVTIVGSASPPSPFQYSLLRPQKLPQKLNSPGLDQLSGRIPTPIHSKFHLTQPPPPPRSRTDSHLSNTVLPGFARPKQRLDDYRMPSPITEDSMETSDLPSSQLSRLSVSQDSMDVDDAVWSQQSHPSSDNSHWDNAPPTPTTPGGRTGRARSGAFSSASTTPQQQNERGGRRVVFGFREDCEKCRMRFPGHFAHFV